MALQDILDTYVPVPLKYGLSDLLENGGANHADHMLSCTLGSTAYRHSVWLAHSPHGTQTLKVLCINLQSVEKVAIKGEMESKPF